MSNTEAIILAAIYVVWFIAAAVCRYHDRETKPN